MGGAYPGNVGQSASASSSASGSPMSTNGSAATAPNATIAPGGMPGPGTGPPAPGTQLQDAGYRRNLGNQRQRSPITAHHLTPD